MSTSTLAAKKTAARKTTAEKPEPPAEAVARDPHWAAKMDRLRSRALAQVAVRLWDDPEDRGDYQTLLATVTRARRSALADPYNELLAAEHDLAVKALERAEQAWADRYTKLTFRALPGDGFSDLVKAHPPTEKDAEDGAEWNPDTFPAALIAASSVDGIDEDFATEIITGWGPADRSAVFEGALAAQNQPRADLGKG